MRKALFVLALAACVPLATFAAGSDFQLGVTALYPFMLQNDSKPSEAEATYISPGVEARLRFLHVLQVGGNATLWRPFVEGSEGIRILSSLDAGLCLDLFLARLGAGLGPAVYYESYEGKSDSESMWNFKLYAEIQIKSLSLGVSALYLFDEDLKVADAFQEIKEWIDNPYLSATLLFKL
jgi:hypothetical protein